MKHHILVLVCIIFSIALGAQEGFKIGIQGGLPVNDFNDRVGVVVGLDLGSMWALGEVVDLGISTGYIHGFPEKFGTENAFIKLPNVQFLPLAASLRIWPSNSVSLGGDIGYALGLNDGNDGGLYYRPMIGFLLGAQTELNFSFTGITLDTATWNTITFGIVYTVVYKRE